MSAVAIAREALCRMLATGELVPGQRLPGEIELCSRFGLSRSSLREAQKMLVAVGVLDSEGGGRLTVSDLSAPKLMAGLSMVVPLLPLNRLLEMFPLRRVLEGHATAQATAKMSGGELTELKGIAGRVASLDVDDPLFEELDQEFHLRIIRSAGDPMIQALLETIHHRGSDYHLLTHGEPSDMKRASDEAHLRIADAMAHRDAVLAQALMTQHIQDSYEWLSSLQPPPRPEPIETSLQGTRRGA